MALIRRRVSHELPVAMAVMVVGVLTCLSVVSGDQHCAGLRPYLRSAGPRVPDSPGLLNPDNMVEEGADPVMDGDLGLPVRRSLASSEAVGSAVSSIIVLLIVVAVIWCCCTGRCCGPHVTVVQQTEVAQAQATAQNQSNNQSVVMNVPEQKPALQMTTVHHYHGPHVPAGPVPAPGLKEVLDAVAVAGAGHAQAVAHAVAGGGPPGADHHHNMHNGAGPGSHPGYNAQQAQYPPPVQGYPAAQNYPPPAHPAQPQPQAQYPPAAPSPLSNYPPPKNP